MATRDNFSAWFWLETCCEYGPDCKTLNAELYGAYAHWCEANGYSPISRLAFGRSIAQRKDLKPYVASGGARGWRGIGLRDPLWAMR